MVGWSVYEAFARAWTYMRRDGYARERIDPHRTNHVGDLIELPELEHLLHLIIRHRHISDEERSASNPLDGDWLPTWRVDGPDEPLDPQRGASVTLIGETRLPILSPGDALDPGSIYLDLRNPAHGPFRALEGQIAGDGNAYVAQGELPADFWHQLVRICSRAGALVIEVGSASCDIILVLEPVASEPAA